MIPAPPQNPASPGPLRRPPRRRGLPHSQTRPKANDPGTPYPSATPKRFHPAPALPRPRARYRAACLAYRRGVPPVRRKLPVGTIGGLARVRVRLGTWRGLHGYA
jgi:hypothetical protein